MKERLELATDANFIRRNIFGEDLTSPIDIFALLNKIENLTWVFYPFQDHISGICAKTQDDMLIAINSTHPYGRQRYTAAHEIYHLFVQENFEMAICPKKFDISKSDEEREADIFASYLLAPKEALRDYYEKNIKQKNKVHFDLEDVVRFEQYFLISRRAAVYRLQNEKYIDINDLTKEQWVSNPMDLATKMGFPISLYQPKLEDDRRATFGRYIRLAEELKEKNIISYGKYNELLLEAFRYDIVYNIKRDGLSSDG